jgi:hypothetical protein
MSTARAHWVWAVVLGSLEVTSCHGDVKPAVKVELPPPLIDQQAPIDAMRIVYYAGDDQELVADLSPADVKTVLELLETMRHEPEPLPWAVYGQLTIIARGRQIKYLVFYLGDNELGCSKDCKTYYRRLSARAFSEFVSRVGRKQPVRELHSAKFGESPAPARH